MSLANFKATNHPQQTSKRGAVDEVDDRATDPAFIATLEERFGAFTLDVAAAAHNAKAPTFFTREDDGLGQDWSGRVWCNPPYSDLRPWVEKAWLEYERSFAVETIVMLVPANRTEQGWWQDLIEPRRDRSGRFRVEFLRGRMRFARPDWTPGPKGDRPPFGCALLIWGDVSTTTTEAIVNDGGLA